MSEIEITQADREAYCDYEDWADGTREVILSGLWDHTAGIHIFAKHRIQARKEALEEAAIKLEQFGWVLVQGATQIEGDRALALDEISSAYECAAQIIRQLATHQHDEGR